MMSVGWSAAYYDGNVETARTLQYRAIDATVNITGGEAARPATTPTSFNGNRGDSFSTVWEGDVVAPSAGVYTFLPTTDDGVRITIDGIVQYDNYNVGQGPTERTIVVDDAPFDAAAVDPAFNGTPVSWTAGSVHRVKFEFQQGGGGYEAIFRYRANTGDPTGAEVVARQIIPAAQVRPLAPTAPVASAAGTAGSAQVSWNQVEAVSYRIEQRNTGTTAWTTAKTVAAANATAGYAETITGLTTGQSYDFRVVAVNPTAETPSNTTTATATLAPTPAPTGVTATPGFNRVTIGWTAVPFADTYIVSRSNTAGGPYVDVTPAGGVTGTSFVDNTAVLGNRYFYVVRTQNAAGQSPNSAEVVGDLQNGVRGYYYKDNQAWNSGGNNNTGWLNVGAPTSNGILPRINYNASPDPSIGPDNYTTLLTGELVIPTAGTYVFATNSDDNSRVVVDGTLVASLNGWGFDAYQGGQRVNDTTTEAGTEIPLTFTAGQRVTVQYWHQEGGGGDNARLLFKPDGGELAPVPDSWYRTSGGTLLAPTATAGTTTSAAATINFTDRATNELHYRLERTTTNPATGTPTWTVVNRSGLLAKLNPTDPALTGSVQDTDVAVGTTYYYRVVADNFEAEAASNVVTVTVPNPVAAAGAAQRFYENQWWNSPTQNTNGYRTVGTPTGATPVFDGGTDPNGDTKAIAYDINSEAVLPPGGTRGANYSQVFTGKIRTDAAGSYRFVARSDDDNYLVVNGQLVSFDPGGHGIREPAAANIVPITLAANTQYDFALFHSQGGGGHGIFLEWEAPDPATPDARLPRVLIPSNRMTSLMSAPAAPTASANPFSNVGANSVTVTFTDNALSELKYVVERATDAGFTQNLTTISAPLQFNTNGAPNTAASFTDTGLATGTTYHYRLRAFNFDAQSANVPLGSVTTSVVGTPTGLSANLQRNNSIVVRWTDNTPTGTKVSVERSVNGGAFTEVAQVDPVTAGGANSYTDSATANSTAYRYRVRAVGGPGGQTSLYAEQVDSVVTYGSSRQVDFANGFTGQTSLTLNGDTVAQAQGLPSVQANGAVRLLNRTNDLETSVFRTEPLTVTGPWVTQFEFTTSAGDTADGFMFVIQNRADTPTTFVGGGGGGLGYNGIGATALGVKFDTHPLLSTTGLWLGNASPGDNNNQVDPSNLGLKNESLNLNAGGNRIDLHNGASTFRVTLNYDGTRLYQQVINLTDPTRGAFQYDYGAVDIKGQLGGSDTGFIGFTAATGGLNNQVDVLNWTYSQGAASSVAPTLTQTIIGDGTNQRSQVKQISLKFSTAVQLAPGALTLNRLNTGGSGTNDGSAPTNASAALGSPTTADGGITWVWSIVGGNPFAQATGAGTLTGSLVDGIYTATVDATKVTAGGTQMAAGSSTTFHRLFGDVNGSRNVNNADYLSFRGAFGKTSSDPAYNAAFDFDNSGVINNADYLQFRSRFGLTYSYT